MNLENYKAALQDLINTGARLYYTLYLEKWARNKQVRGNLEELGGELELCSHYQAWYTEAHEVIRQILPARLEDFERYYKGGSRDEITFDTYTIQDALNNLKVTKAQGWPEIVVADFSAAIPKLRQQYEIVKSLEKRFESSLFDIKALAQADLYDNELDTAEHLNKNSYHRAAGAVAGVVLEGHLAQVCENHGIRISKKSPGLADLNNALKNADIIETAEWRRIQYLGDIRNKCDHKKTTEPTHEEIGELIKSTKRILKNLF